NIIIDNNRLFKCQNGSLEMQVSCTNYGLLFFTSILNKLLNQGDLASWLDYPKWMFLPVLGLTLPPHLPRPFPEVPCPPGPLPVKLERNSKLVDFPHSESHWLFVSSTYDVSVGLWVLLT